MKLAFGGTQCDRHAGLYEGTSQAEPPCSQRREATEYSVSSISPNNEALAGVLFACDIKAWHHSLWTTISTFSISVLTELSRRAGHHSPKVKTHKRPKGFSQCSDR